MKAYDCLVRRPLIGHPAIKGTMRKIIIYPLDFYKIDYIIKTMNKNLIGGEAMAKVKLIGDVQLEFEVKFGLERDLVITVYAISANGMKAFVGQADISGVPDKTLFFIGERIESLLKKKEKGAVGLDGFGKFFEYGNPLKEVKAEELKKAMYQNDIGTLIMRAYLWQRPEALEEALQKNLFPLSTSGMQEFRAWKRVKEKGGSVDSVYKYLR
jgi:hypothetical protein